MNAQKNNLIVCSFSPNSQITAELRACSLYTHLYVSLYIHIQHTPTHYVHVKGYRLYIIVYYKYKIPVQMINKILACLGFHSI